MSQVELPWETEQVIETSKSQFVNGSISTPVLTSLISNLKNPTEFALIVIDDDEAIAEAASSQPGFLGKLKSFANTASSQAAKVQRQVTAGCNRLAATYGVKLVLPVATNVDYKISGGSLSCCWTSVDSGKMSARVNGLSEKFVNIFSASREISLSKNRAEFVPNGSGRAFSWLWKYQPAIPMPSTQNSKDLLPTDPVDNPRGKLMCLSWNVAGLPPPEDNPSNVLVSCYSKQKKQFVKFFSEKTQYDIVVVALQEASPLNAKTVLFKGSDTNYGEAWLEWFNDVLSSSVSPKGSAEWVRTTAIVQVGLAIAMFVRNRLDMPDEAAAEALRVKAPMTSCVRTGTLGLTGNKGCVGVRSTISYGQQLDFSVNVINVHLSSGEGKSDFRKGELTKVVNESSFDEDKSMHFFDSDLAIVAGDLNSRVNEEGGVDYDGSEICTEDELLVRMREEGSGFLFNENPVEFPATYKLVPGEEGRLVFASNRKPAWCDRVLFRSMNISCGRFFCSQYSSLREVDFSDHTPIFATFELGEPVNAGNGCEDDRSTIPSNHYVGAPEVQFGIGNTESAQQSSSENDSDLYDQ